MSIFQNGPLVQQLDVRFVVWLPNLISVAFPVSSQPETWQLIAFPVYSLNIASKNAPKITDTRPHSASMS